MSGAMGHANALRWLFVFIAVSPPRATAAPAGSQSSAKIGVNRCAQGVLIATPSRVAKSPRHQVGFDLREAPHRYGALPTTRRAPCLHGRVRPQAGRGCGVARRQAGWPRWGGWLPVREKAQLAPRRAAVHAAATTAFAPAAGTTMH